MDLIHDGKRRGHPSYADLDMTQVLAKARQRLSESGVLSELVAQLGHDDGLDKVLAQKAASPHAVAQNVREVFTDSRPNAVLQEKSSNAERDLALTESEAWLSLGSRMVGQEVVATTGSHMEDTFVYDFLAKAYPFLHKSVLAYPDYGLVATPRAACKGPKVDLAVFSACMNRRIEQQYRASWSYNYTPVEHEFPRSVKP